MTAEPHHHYEDLHRLVDQLEPDEADAVHAVVRSLVTKNRPAPVDHENNHQPRRHFAFAGSISAEPDLAERSEEILDEIIRRHAG